jgi:hypothetical protein
LTALGRYDEAIAVASANPAAYTMALEAGGRYEEALSSSKAEWMRSIQLLRLGRYAEDEPFMAGETNHRYLMAALLAASGRMGEARDLLAKLARLHHPQIGMTEVWFKHWFLGILLDNRDGHAIDPAAAWHDLLEDHRFICGQSPWYLAALVTGRIDEAAFLVQPMRNGAEQRMHLARGIRAEFAHDWPAAVVEYRAYVDGSRRASIAYEDYAKWRLAELERASTTP